jgi:hypothetical protein
VTRTALLAVGLFLLVGCGGSGPRLGIDTLDGDSQGQSVIGMDMDGSATASGAAANGPAPRISLRVLGRRLRQPFVHVLFTAAHGDRHL